jgi:hypothetical protein
MHRRSRRRSRERSCSSEAGRARYVVSRRDVVIQTLCTGRHRFRKGAWMLIMSRPFRGLGALIESVDDESASVSVPGLKERARVDLDKIALAAYV